MISGLLDESFSGLNDNGPIEILCDEIGVSFTDNMEDIPTLTAFIRILVCEVSFPCLAAGDKWKEKAFSHDATGRMHYEQVRFVSRQIGKSIWTSKGGKARNEEMPPCAICSI